MIKKNMVFVCSDDEHLLRVFRNFSDASKFRKWYMKKYPKNNFFVNPIYIS